MILIKFVVKVWPSGLQQYEKRKLFAGAFQEFLQKNSKYLLFRTLFVECFCYNERIKGMLKCLLYIALISNAFFDESKDQRKRYSLRSVRKEMEDSVFIKTEDTFGTFCFWLQISNLWQK